jgi:tRNA pseudouridine38/39 synthase
VPFLKRKRLDHANVANDRWEIGRANTYRKQKQDETPDATERTLAHVV